MKSKLKPFLVTAAIALAVFLVWQLPSLQKSFNELTGKKECHQTQCSKNPSAATTSPESVPKADAETGPFWRRPTTVATVALVVVAFGAFLLCISTYLYLRKENPWITMVVLLAIYVVLNMALNIYVR